MQVKLTRPNRIEKGRAGDIVEVEPARARYLIGMKMAEPVLIREQVEAPEKKAEEKKTAKASEKAPAKKTAKAGTRKK